MKKAEALILFLIFVVIYFATRGTFLFDKYSINGDASQHLVWLKQVEGFFPTDETVGFSRLIEPIGYKLIYRAFLTCFDLKTASVILDIIRCTILFLLSFFIVKKQFGTNKNRVLFYAAIATLFLATATMGNIGIARSYASIFIMGTVCSLLYKNNYALAVNLLVASVVYPSAFLISIVYAAFTYLFTAINEKTSIKKLFIVSLPVVVAIVVGLAINVMHSNEIINDKSGGEVINLDFIKHDPHATQEGRVNLIQFWDHPVTVLTHIIFGYTTQFVPIKAVTHSLPLKSAKSYNPDKIIAVLAALFAVYLLYLLYSKRKGLRWYVNYPSVKLIVSGIILYSAAIILPFKLFIPGRYIDYTFVIGVAFLIVELIRSAPNSNAMKVVGVLFFGTYIYTNVNYTEDSFKEDSQMFTEVANSIPPKARILCNSIYFQDMIPIFSNRSVFNNYESLHAIYYKHYRDTQDEKLRVWNQIFSTNDPAELAALLDKNEINYLLLRAPYDKIIDEKVPAPAFITENANSSFRAAIGKVSQYKEFTSNNFQYRIYKVDGLKAALAALK